MGMVDSCSCIRNPHKACGSWYCMPRYDTVHNTVGQGTDIAGNMLHYYLFHHLALGCIFHVQVTWTAFWMYWPSHHCSGKGVK